MQQSIRKFENVHILLWLVKDTCWVMNYQVLGVLMIVPTFFVAALITWKTRNVITDLFHNLAICFWIIANSTWMIGEFFYEDVSRPYATVFFIIGIMIISYYYLFLGRGAEKLVITEFPISKNTRPLVETVD